MRREHCHKLLVEPFNYQVNIVLTDDVIESRVKRNRALGTTATREDLTGTIALHSASKTAGVSYIFLPFKADIGYITHECSHCVWRIMEFIGAEHENEVMAYMLAYLVRKAVSFSHGIYLHRS